MFKTVGKILFVALCSFLILAFFHLVDKIHWSKEEVEEMRESYREEISQLEQSHEYNLIDTENRAFDDGYEQGYEKGFKDGFSEGYSDASYEDRAGYELYKHAYWEGYWAAADEYKSWLLDPRTDFSEELTAALYHFWDRDPFPEGKFSDWWFEYQLYNWIKGIYEDYL